MKMVEVKTAELIGSALDWAVAQIEKPANLICLNSFNGGPRTRGNLPHYSADWSQGGPMIEKYDITFMRGVEGADEKYFAVMAAPSRTSIGQQTAGGETHLIAACRAIVAAKLGDVVSVPAELVNGGAV